MKIVIAILVVGLVLASVFCMFARELMLMLCAAGNLSEDLEDGLLFQDTASEVEAQPHGSPGDAV